jgi:type IV pilus assembly protein PilE
MSRRTKGFTLMEVMIVVAIIGILASIAYPSYTEHVRKTRRTDATATLQSLAQRMERCYSQSFTYTGCLAASVASDQGFYTVTVSVPTAATFALTAAPTAGGPQASDAKCKKFILTNTGARSAEPSAASICW